MEIDLNKKDMCIKDLDELVVYMKGFLLEKAINKNL